MECWGGYRRVFIGQHEDQRYERELRPRILKEEESDYEEEEEEKTIKTEDLPEIKTRKRRSRSELREVKEEPCGSRKLKTEKHGNRDRWSAGRYKSAEQSMWEVLKAEGATFENPITRPALRMAARKHISDTGLLDHLLGHIDGQVTPGGTERFRRCFNTKGIMEYWLESADLEKARQEAGLQDSHNTNSSDELKLLKIEMAQMKKDMQELIAKQQQKSEISLMEESNNEFVKWKAAVDHRLTEIMASVNGLQGNYGELAIWKTKVEQQLAEITNKLSVHKSPKECMTSSPASDRWRDWIESNNLGGVQDNEFATWIGTSELLNVPQEVALEDPNSALPTQPLNEELTNKKSSDLLEMVPTRSEDQPNVTPDSSTTVNSKSDVDSSLVMFQEMFMDIFKWREQIEQQLMEVSNAVYSMLAMK